MAPRKMVVREGLEGDLESLTEIYNDYVEHSVCTFDTEPFAVSERKDWFRRFGKTGAFRLFVGEIRKEIIGYTSSCPFAVKRGYQFSVETSVYLAREFHGKGYGKELLGTLLAVLEKAPQVHRAYAGIVLPGLSSVGLHESLGFTKAAHFHEVGFKSGSYHDVVWYEKDLS
jgi:phosphinothricin acetyltransferase